MVSREERLEAFASFPERLSGAALAAAGRTMPPGEWNAAEVVRHLIAVEEEVHVTRLREATTHDNPHWTWTEPGVADDFEGATLAEILNAFATARAATIRLIRGLDDVGWARYGTHATYGRLDVAGLLRLASDHDAEHLCGLG